MAIGHACRACAERMQFHIPAGPAATTLRIFADQSHQNVLFPMDEVESQLTKAVTGILEPKKALKLMFAGTGLTYRFVGNGFVVRAAVASQDPDTNPEGPRLETVEVGAQSWFRGEIERPIGVTPLRITEEDIRDSGAVSVGEVLRTLPQVFGGGPSENTHDFGREAQSNSALGTGLNLRGLGAGATLILVNGRPLAPSGTVGGFVDISNLPLSAIDHVDVLSYGGSVLYGGDAIGGIVNFVLRDYEGLELEGRLSAHSSESIGSRQFHLTYGKSWDSGKLMISSEYYDRDGLWASQRSQATSDLRPFGGNNFDTLAGNPGTLVYAGQTWAIPHNQNGQNLRPTSFVPNTFNESDLLKGAEILPSEQLRSVMFKGTEYLSGRMSLFFDALASRRTVRTQEAQETASLTVTPANPFYVNPIGGTGQEQILYAFGSDLGLPQVRNVIDSGQLTFGADFRVGNTWKVQVYWGFAQQVERQQQLNTVNYAALTGALNNSDPAQSFNAFGDGSWTNPAVIQSVRGMGEIKLRSRIAFDDAMAQGPLIRLPAGDLEVALGTNFRQQSFHTQTVEPGQMALPNEDLGRTTWAVFGQATLPLLGKDQAMPGLESLELSCGLRDERYSDAKPGLIPQLGIEAALSSRVALRASWVRAFKEPNLADLSETSNVNSVVSLADPQSTAVSRQSSVLILEGNNDALKPEAARTWTLGVDLSPFADRSAKLALTYFHTKFSDLVETAPALSPDALSNPEFLPYVYRNVSYAERFKLCQQGQFSGRLSDCWSLPVAAVIDLRLHNRPVIETSGIDLNTRYTFGDSIGRITVGLLGTYLLDYAEAPASSVPLTSVLNTEHNPINLRLRGSLNWKWGSLRMAWFVNYQNSYRDVESVPQRSVAAWTTVDASLGYEIEKPESLGLKSLSVTLSALNLFNQNPPFLNNSYEKIGYDEENGDLVGRAARVAVRVQW